MPAVAPARAPSSLLLRFVALQAAVYGAYGVASPFFPAFLESRGLGAEQLGASLASATAVRLIVAPLVSRLGDVRRALRTALVLSAGAAALVTLGFLPARGFWPVVALVLLQSAALAPIAALADALAVAHARPPVAGRGFEYGWVRGAGSAAFVVGMVVAGQAIRLRGLAVVIELKAVLLVVVAVRAALVPEVPAKDDAQRERTTGVRDLLRSTWFRRLLLVAALVLGSHAMHDAFAVIRWKDAGIEARTASVLWSESVVAEVLVFVVVGPSVVRSLGPPRAMAIAAAAAAARWFVLASTVRIPLLALVEPLHGLTFALFHLSAIRLVADEVPRPLQATALALYGTIGIGAATALLTLASGSLYARIGASGFAVMAALAAAAVPLALRLSGLATRRT